MKKTLFLTGFVFIFSTTVYSQYLDAGRDTVVCPGNIIRLGGVGDSLYFYYRWRPSHALSDSTVPAPYCWADTTMTYYVYAYKADSLNLVHNGDFQSGNTGFTSQYTYGGTGMNALWPEGTYSVISTASLVHNNFPQRWDHTWGNSQGLYMAVNGARTANTVVWSQTINSVTPHTDYVFYAWAVSLIAESPATLQFNINGNLIGPPFPLSANTNAPWQQFYTIWNSGTNTSAVITIVNQTVAQSGNDFGLDDIFFAPIIPDIDSVTVYMKSTDSSMTVVEMCHNSSYVFNNKRIIVESGLYVDTLKTVWGCDSLTYLDIRFYPELAVELGENITVCQADIPFVALEADSGFHAYKWNTGDTTRKIAVAESGIYSVTVYNKIGCYASDDIEVNFVAIDDIKITTDVSTLCENDYTMTLTVETEAPDILWSTGEVTGSVDVHRFGTYYVVVSDDYCKKTDTIEIEFCCPEDSGLPNVITPSDANGINDFFEFTHSMPYEKMEIYIYDRWGKRVYKSRSPDFKWDGVVNGKVEKGVYYYVVRLEDGCAFHGSLTVL